MPYNNRNHLKKVRYVIDLYAKVKEEHISDAKIVAKVFPLYGVHFSYRTWMNIKSMKQSSLPPSQQGVLFA